MCDLKIYSKFYSTLCATTHYDAMTLECDGVDSDIKGWLYCGPPHY